MPLVLSLFSMDVQTSRNFTEIEQEQTQDSEIVIYKRINGHSLKALIYRNPRNNQNKRLPGFVFFHGGGWAIGKPEWGEDTCRRYSSLGFVSISFEYRLERKHHANALDAIRDAKSAIRWTREHASELGIDPNQIVAYGFSAGGHLASCAALIEGLDEQNDNPEISSVPNVLIVKSAPIIIFQDNSHFTRIGGISSVKECSPIEHIRPNLPPTLLIHGSLDPYTPLWSVKEFEKQMKRFDNRCELHIYEGIKHLDWDPVAGEVFEVMDRFLESLGYMEEE
jgi:acetyl esterase/lipase